MDIKNYTPKKELANDVLVKQDGAVYTKESISIMFPKHWLDRYLGSLTEYFNVVGFFALFYKDQYCIFIIPSMFSFSPDNVVIESVEDVSYFKLEFEQGSQVTPSFNLFADDKTVYEVYDEIIAKGKPPFYIDYVTHMDLLKHSKKYAHFDLGADPAILEMLSANRARSVDNLNKHYRETIKDQSSLKNNKPSIIPLRDIGLGATNMVSRTLGSYPREGITASLVNDPKQLGEIEEILKY